ncbi:MAG: outer membrane homotrimeric porin [Desulfovibrionaceae bacterium]
MKIKKILSMFFTFGIFFCSLTNLASAAEFKFSGTYQMSTEYNRNINFTDGNSFLGIQRFRPVLSAVANEYLYANIGIEIGNAIWGNGPQGAGLGSDQFIIKVRHAFIDWKTPGLTNLSFRVGIQGFNTPSATFGSPVYDDTGAGIALDYAISENVALGISWVRPYIPLATDLQAVSPGATPSGLDAADAFLFDLPLSFASVTFTPWGGVMNVTEEALISLTQGDPNNILSGSAGKTLSRSIINRPKQGTLLPSDTPLTKNNGLVWWAGVALEVNAVKNLTIGFDFVYGATEYERSFAAKTALYDPNTEGFYTAFLVEYSLPIVTIGLKYWYASGNSSDFERNGGGIMPSLIPSYIPALFAFDAATTYRGSCDQLGGDFLASNQGAGIEFSDITFIKNVTHLIEFAYILGTSSASTASTTFDPRTMTTKDQSILVNFVTEYAIYENLSTQFGISYIYMLENNKMYTAGNFAKDNFAAGVGIQYKF